MYYINIGQVSLKNSARTTVVFLLTETSLGRGFECSKQKVLLYVCLFFCFVLYHK